MQPNHQRRTWLKLGVGSLAVLALAGGTLALIAPGLDKSGRLSSSGRTVFAALGHAFLMGSLPAQPPANQVAMLGLLDRIDTLTSALPEHAQVELSQLLSLLASTPGRWGLAGLGIDWASASVTDIQKALQTMRVSGTSLKRQAYQALHDIVGAAYFSEPSTWAQLGYPGPPKV